MPNAVHPYPVVVDWRGGREGEGQIVPGASEFVLPINVPPEFGGQGGRTNPEELLTSAIAGCYSITFGIVAANRKLPVESVRVEANGEVEQTGATFKYRSITLQPTIVLAPEATEEQANLAAEMAHKCDAYCIVTNAVRGTVEVTIDPKVVRAAPAS
jgi:peroxiredoxin-like protein